MPVTYAGWAVVGTPGGEGGSSATVSARFGTPRRIIAQAAIGYLGGSGPIGEIGFSAVVQNGQYRTIGNDVYSSWLHALDIAGVTQIDVSARSYDGMVWGSVVFYQY